ncbi:MAG: hypothetical protein KGL46_07310 [Hyphomicrobiales bacterium]|nr:hypothetical protein [Hyphomicrobiales bacterium]
MKSHIFLFAGISETGKAHCRLSGFRHCSRIRLTLKIRLQRNEEFMYTAPCAAVVVEARPSDTHLTEIAAMIITGVILCVLGIALLCWLLFALAVQALPLFVGTIAATLVFQGGADTVLAIAIGLVAAALAVGIARFLYITTRSSLARAAVALLVTAPAVFAGYHATLGVARITVSSEPGRQTLALVGSFVIGCVALLRLNVAATRAANPPTTANTLFASAATPNDG